MLKSNSLKNTRDIDKKLAWTVYVGGLFGKPVRKNESVEHTLGVCLADG